MACNNTENFTHESCFLVFFCLIFKLSLLLKSSSKISAVKCNVRFPPVFLDLKILQNLGCSQRFQDVPIQIKLGYTARKVLQMRSKLQLMAGFISSTFTHLQTRLLQLHQPP